MRRALLVMVVVGSTGLGAPARGDTRAMTAARAVFPAKLAWMGGMNLGADGARPILARAWTAYVGREAGGPIVQRKIIEACGADLPDLIDSFVVGSFDEKTEQTAIVVGLATLHHKTFDACLQKLATSLGAPITIDSDGDLSRYRARDGVVVLRWLSDDSFALGALGGDDADQLAKMTAGGFGDDRAMAALVAKVDTSAVGWGVVAQPAVLEDLGEAPDLAWGTLSLARGVIHVDVEIDFHTAAVATRAARMMKQSLVAQIADLPGAKPLADGIAIMAKGRALTIGAAISLKELAAAASLGSAAKP